MAFCLFYIQGQGEACKDKIDAGKTQRSASLRGIWLHAKLDNFGFSKIKFFRLRAVFASAELQISRISSRKQF